MVLNWKWMIYECVFRMGSIKQHMCAKLCTMPTSPTAIWLVRALKTPTAEQDVQRLHGQCFTVQWLELWDLGVWYSRSRSHERYPAETLPDISGWGIQGGWGPTIYDMHNAHALRYCYWWSSFFDHVSQVEASPQHAMQVTKNLVENMQQSPATSLHLHGFYMWRILAYLGHAWFQIFDQQPCDCVFKCFVGSVYIYIYIYIYLYIERFPIYPCIPPSRRHTHTHIPLPLNPRWPDQLWPLWRKSLHRPGIVWGHRKLCLGIGLWWLMHEKSHGASSFWKGLCACQYSRKGYKSQHVTQLRSQRVWPLLSLLPRMYTLSKPFLGCPGFIWNKQMIEGKQCFLFIDPSYIESNIRTSVILVDYYLLCLILWPLDSLM